VDGGGGGVDGDALWFAVSLGVIADRCGFFVQPFEPCIYMAGSLPSGFTTGIAAISQGHLVGGAGSLTFHFFLSDCN
jgi:hypothetical protein